MPDEPKTKSRGHGTIAACTLVFLLIVYVLSVGPVALLVMRADLDETTVAALEWVYSPLWVFKSGSPLRNVIDWYIDLWQS